MHEFDDIFHLATANIGAAYMQLPIAGAEDPVYRERVYCYELYHQLRVLWPAATSYSLGGEVDKKGHPLIRGNGLDNVKPDLLVHIPGDMGGNSLVIEVKPIGASNSGLRKDLRTLTAFVRHGQYARAILLLYGAGVPVDKVISRLQVIHQADGGETIDLHSIEIWVHAAPDDPAHRVA